MITNNLSCAWAKEKIGESPTGSEEDPVCLATEPKVSIGDQVMVICRERPSVEIGQALPWSLQSKLNTAQVVLIEKPKELSIFVALNRICLCYVVDNWTEEKDERLETVETQGASF